jgi:hypothetical protein
MQGMTYTKGKTRYPRNHWENNGPMVEIETERRPPSSPLALDYVIYMTYDLHGQ